MNTFFGCNVGKSVWPHSEGAAAITSGDLPDSNFLRFVNGFKAHNDMQGGRSPWLVAGLCVHLIFSRVIRRTRLRRPADAGSR
jgi:hypothetical protein